MSADALHVAGRVAAGATAAGHGAVTDVYNVSYVDETYAVRRPDGLIEIVLEGNEEAIEV